MPEITRHATPGPPGRHWNKVCSLHGYSLNQIRTGDTGIYVNEVVPHSSADVLPRKTTGFCMYFRPEWATCVTSLERLQREPETPTWILLSSTQELQVKQEHVTFTYICGKCTGTFKVSTRGEYGTGSSYQPVCCIFPISEYILSWRWLTLNIPHFSDRWQWTGDSEHSPQPFTMSSKSSSAHRQNKIYSLVLIPEAWIHFFKVVELHNTNNNDCQKVWLKLL